MDDELDELLVEVRADTRGFARDMADMRGTFDNTLLDGFAKAGNILERGLVSAIRKGSLSFDDLKQTAFAVFDQIANQALAFGLDSLLGGNGGSKGGGLADLIGGSLGALFGLPGRAIGGEVSPGRPFVVGERGPELFVPTSAGRVETGTSARGSRDVRVAINLNAPRGSDVPASLQRSSRQVASAVRRALASS